jgi:hypothetical protein
MSLRPCPAALAIVATLGLLATSPARALSDYKAFGAAECEPYAPDTTRAELAYSPNGIYNPGTTSEKVMCVLIRDQDSGNSQFVLDVIVHYRVLGSAAARMTCTLWLGSTSQQYVTQYTETKSGPFVNAGTTTSMTFEVFQASPTVFLTPVSLLCVIPPKTSFGAIVQAEDSYAAP